MRYLLIKGSLHVVGYSPDGDSMMFKAANPAIWDGLENENKELFTEKLTKEIHADRRLEQDIVSIKQQLYNQSVTV